MTGWQPLLPFERVLNCSEDDQSDECISLQNASEVTPAAQRMIHTCHIQCIPFYHGFELFPFILFALMVKMKALKSIDHLVFQLIIELMNHSLVTGWIQEKLEADSNAFLHVDFSDGIMPGLARYKNCDLSSDVETPCPKSMYEYYTSLEGQCLAVELIFLILVCLIFHCLASIIYLSGRSLCISLITPLSLIIKLFI